MSKEQNNTARRKLLKSLALGGGVAASAAPILPKKWVSPVVNNVLLPAHANTTNVVLDGVYTGDVQVAELSEPATTGNAPTMIARASGIGHEILEFLVPSAEASHARTGWCNEAAPMLMFQVNEAAGTVNICATWGTADSGNIVDQAASTLSGNAIADFKLTGGDDDVEGEGEGGISITNCQISADGQTISGNHSAVLTDNNSATCSGSFSLSRSGAAYSCSPNNEDGLAKSEVPH